MKISVIGTGYVGLVSGTCFAESGNEVICIDINADKVEKMKNGQIPIYEPGLETLFHRNIKANRLQFSTDLQKGVQHGEVIFLALPTPEDEDGSADLSYVMGVAEKIGEILEKSQEDNYKIIVNKSTVPVGTAEKVTEIIKNKTNKEFDVVSNPEFLREGFAVDDFMKPERVVIGTNSDKAQTKMRRLYAPFVRSGNPILMMDPRSSEITKYASNSFLAMKITFMNEIANFAERVGADVDKIRIGMGTDSRIGKRFLFPGIGYGGSCFPKDVKALYKTGNDHNYNFKLLESVISINEKQRRSLIPKILHQFNNDIKGKKIAMWGLAFKPETDDIREAPALYMIQDLLDAGADIHVFDPEAMENVKRKFGNKLTYGANMYDILDNADALVVSTEWNVFRTPNFSKIKELMHKPLVFDGRNVYQSDEMQQHGFTYYSVGRKAVNIPRKLWKEF
jgi:UDPglucose 6-dehydrogenase